MSRPNNRRDALLASGGLAIAATAPPSALAQAPSSTAVSTILKSQSLAPLMGAPVQLGRAENGAIVNEAALDAHAKTFVSRTETVKVTDNIWMIEDPSASSAFIVGNMAFYGGPLSRSLLGERTCGFAICLLMTQCGR